MQQRAQQRKAASVVHSAAQVGLLTILFDIFHVQVDYAVTYDLYVLCRIPVPSQ